MIRTTPSPGIPELATRRGAGESAGGAVRVGLDVGGTKIDAVAVAPSGEIIGRLRRPTGWGDDAVVESIVLAVRALAAENAIAMADIGSVGIGMAMAQAILRAQHGDIRADSQPGSGASFTVLFQASDT